MILVRTFSKKNNKKDDSDDSIKGAALAAAGMGTLVGGSKLSDLANKKTINIVENTRNNSQNARKVKRALLKEAREKGVSVRRLKDAENAAYMGTPGARGFRKILTKGLKVMPKETRTQVIEGINSGFSKDRNFPGMKINDLGKDRILIGKGRSNSMSDVDVVAHELGHREHSVKGGTGKLIGKLAHKTPSQLISNVAGTKAGKAAFFINGVHSGMKKERNKKEGKKTGTWTKVKSVALPAAAVAPGLIAEAAASRHGYRAMKRLGANKEVLKQSRKKLGSAFGSYLSNSAKPLIMGASGELVGRGIGKVAYKNVKDDE